MLTLQEAGILSTTFEAILYGYAVFMFSLAMWILLRDRRERQVNYALVAAGCSLITLATAEMAVNITRIFQGFITKGPFLNSGPEAYFAVVSDPTFVTKSVLYNVQTLILDAVVIYRTYVVWQSGLIVLLPIIGWCGLLAGSIGLNVALMNSEHMGDVFAVQTGRWITAVYALTLGTNLSSTILLAGRIWTVARRSAQYRSSNIFSPVLRVIIESGAIYSMTITAALISFVVQSNGVYILLDMISPIISIVFNMLIIRMGLAGDRTVFGASTSATAALPWQAGTSGSGWATDRSGVGAVAIRRRTGEPRYEMKDLKVEITQVIEDDSEYAVTGHAGSQQHHVQVGAGALGMNMGSMGARELRVMSGPRDEEEELEGTSPNSSFHEGQLQEKLAVAV
ncbi:hypothetical protein PYCCODRAFT_1447350 [Trametes coccinea BRFM310]|uniref:Uncharacterized protein n=1 Tax=Trametes coccinea (strain BRFM310) TaxID=1353009 RepID=A0A1Y2IBW2_TRAC3|nr:hypothetical protein PYCCODRAFT_1447350 [Trametes coccinea BRFM310]